METTLETPESQLETHSPIEQEISDCPLEECMKLIGGAWTPNVIWGLGDSSKRFSELKRELHGISSKVLSARLRKLERDGVIARTVEETSPPSVRYELTETGRELRPVIDAIVDVSKRLKSARLQRIENAKLRPSEAGQ